MWSCPLATVFPVLFVLSVLGSDDECPPRSNPRQITAISTAQFFLTPGYTSGRYDPNMDCHWIIVAPGPESDGKSHRIQLTIHDSVIEDRLFTSCDDYLEVRDGQFSRAHKIHAQLTYALNFRTEVKRIGSDCQMVRLLQSAINDEYNEQSLYSLCYRPNSPEEGCQLVLH